LRDPGSLRAALPGHPDCTSAQPPIIVLKPAYTRALLRLALAAIALAVFAHTRADPDLWGHVRFGHDIVASHDLRPIDPYSFTSDRPWVNHEWLAETMMYGAYALGGGTGLIVLKIVLLLVMLGAVAATLRAEGIPVSRWDRLIALVVIGTVAQANHVRPQLFSLALFAWLLATLGAAARGRRLALLLAVPILTVWANVHGGWIVGAVTLAVWAGAGLIDQISWRERLITGAAALAAVAATLINPYGWNLWTFLHETVGFGRTDITDWQPVFRMGVAFVLLWAMVGVAMIVAVDTAIRRQSLDMRSLAVVSMFAVASFRVNRLLAFFAISVVVLMGRHLAAAIPTLRGRTGVNAPRSRTDVNAHRSRLGPAAALAIGCAVLMAAGMAAARNATCVRIEASMLPEPEVALLVSERHLQGRILTWFDWGEYAIWHFAPGMSVSMDGRRETVYSDAVLQQHERFYFAPAERHAIVAALRPDYIWLPSELEVGRLLQADGWSPIFNGNRSVLLARDGTHLEIGQTGEAGRRCFPGP